MTATDTLTATFTGENVERVLDLARRHLDMDVALLSEFTDGEQRYRAGSGDAVSFGCDVGASTPLEQTYCQLMATGQIANAIPDAATHPVVGRLPATSGAGIGAYVGVPIELSDGSLFGSLCVLSHEAQPVDDRDARFLRLLAELISGEVEADRGLSRTRQQISALIQAKDLDIALQPITHLTSGQILGVEALSRFPTELGPPDQVFSAAHHAGVGLDLELLSLSRAFDVLDLLRPELYLAINLSPEAAAHLAGDEQRLADRPYDQIVLEITEHDAVDSYGALNDSLAQARARGMRLAIDDAGAGYASLSHIVRLAPDIIKIDRSLIAGISASSALRSVVRALVTLARDLDALVVAEGVESTADLETVRDLRVDAVQGYMLARPSTDRADLARWLDPSAAAP